MRKAIRIIAASFGIFAGFGGLEHGYFEILQGNVRPESIMIVSMGAPCVPEEIWNACEPAMTIIPNFLVTGILAKLWPWMIVVFFVWLFGQFVIGYFFNEFLMENAVLIPILILGLLVVSILAGYGHDIQQHRSAED